MRPFITRHFRAVWSNSIDDNGYTESKEAPRELQPPNRQPRSHARARAGGARLLHLRPRHHHGQCQEGRQVRRRPPAARTASCDENNSYNELVGAFASAATRRTVRASPRSWAINCSAAATTAFSRAGLSTVGLNTISSSHDCRARPDPSARARSSVAAITLRLALTACRSSMRACRACRDFRSQPDASPRAVQSAPRSAGTCASAQKD